MLKRIVFTGLGIALLASPFVTSAQATDVQSLINTLLAQIKALQAQIMQMQGQTATNSCLTLQNNLYLDQTDATTNGEVTKLQQFLGGQVTGYYGPATLQLVQNWQSSHGVVSSGSPDTTGYGYVGPKTRAALMCNGTATPSGATTNTSPVPTFMEGSTSTQQAAPVLVVTPTSGTAPLSVTFKISALRSGHTIEFGDGFKVSMLAQCAASGNCGTPAYEKNYTYTTPGTYKVRLIDESGATLGAATVTVLGSATGSTSACKIDYPEGANIRSSMQSTANECKSFCDLYGERDAESHGGGTVCRFENKEIANYTAITCRVAYPEGATIRATYHSTENECKSYCDAYGSTDAAAHGGEAVCRFKGNQIASYSAPRAISFTASPSTGVAPLSVTFKVPALSSDHALDFGDGVIAQVIASCAGTGNCGTSAYEQQHTYATSGTYTAKLLGQCIGDSFTCSAAANGGRPVLGSATITVTAQQQPQPTPISFTASPSSGTAPLSVSFKFSGPANPYALDFGDGVTLGVQSSCSPTCGSVSFEKSHTYATPGTYTARMRDTSGATYGAATVTVLNSSSAQAPIISSFIATPAIVAPYEAVTLSFSVSAVNSCAFSSYDVAMGGKINDLPGATANGTGSINSSFVVTPDKSIKYVMTCTGADNTISRNSVVVSVNSPGASSGSSNANVANALTALESALKMLLGKLRQ